VESNIIDTISFEPDAETLSASFRVDRNGPDCRTIARLCKEAQEIAKPKFIYKVAFIEVRGEDFVVLDGVIFNSRVMRVNAHRHGKWTVTAATWMEREIIAVFPGLVVEAYGIAIDVGSTTVSGYLCNLKTRRLIATESLLNPQTTYGDDVIARITYVIEHPDGLVKLRGAILEGLNRIIRTITEDAGLSPADILEKTGSSLPQRSYGRKIGHTWFNEDEDHLFRWGDTGRDNARICS